VCKKKRIGNPPAGTDWFWSATAGAVADVTDLVAGEKRRIV
jgi:hypothetical protein